MNFFGRVLGLDLLGDGFPTEIMSWGSSGSGTSSDPDWGLGDILGFEAVGADNGCL